MAQHTHPITGARYPDSASAVTLDTYYANIVNDLSPMVSTDFATNAARDTAFGNWVSAGNSMRNGLQCTVSGVPQQYRNGSWRGLVPTTATVTTFFATTFSNTTETGIATLAIPDPGWPYILKTSGVIAIAATAGVQANVRARLDSVTGTVISQDVPRSGQFPAGEIMGVPLGACPSGTLTGAHSVVVTARMISGSGNWAVAAGGSLFNCDIFPSYA